MDLAKSERFEFNSICRLCIQLLETEEVSPIFNNEHYAERVTLPERIRYCSSIEVFEGDGLPNNICSSCLLKLNQSFVFRNQCVLADNTLKKLKKGFNHEISHILDVDIENQVIELENTPQRRNSCNSKVKADETCEKISENGKGYECVSIDEFDNSKNGRHKRNIYKSKDRLMQRGKMCNNGIARLRDFTLYISDDSDADVNSVSDEGVANKRLKRKKVRVKQTKKNEVKFEESSEADASGNESGVKTRGRGRRTKVRKSLDDGGGDDADDDVEIKEEIKEEVEDVQDIIENFTVEPDVFDFVETSRGGGSEDEHRSAEQIVEIGKTNKEKLKRGRPRKCAAVKEKPSSYTCDYCHKVYPSEGGWRYHIHTMHNENYQPFICDLCGKAFKVKKNLEGHKNSIHYHLKHHLCDICGRGFASKYALKVHKIWHNDEKNFPCDICGTKFRTRGKMNTHRSIHGGPKKFMCHVCSRDFRWKKDFEIHMRTHTGEKPFNCSHCGKAFSSLTNMKKHERNHAGKARMNFTPETVQAEDVMYKTDMNYHYGCEGVDSPPGEFS